MIITIRHIWINAMTCVSTEYLDRCLETLEKSYAMIQAVDSASVEYEMYRNSLVKGFEMTLEQSGKLLRKELEPYFSSKREIDKLSFKDVFRYALKYSLLDENCINRWFKYRDNRNNIAHDYGQAFAEDTLALMPSFIADVKQLKRVLHHV